MRYFLIAFLSFFIFSFCKTNEIAPELKNPISIIVQDSSKIKSNEIKKTGIIVNDSTFVNLKDYSNDFVYDMKYATTDNFLKSKVYDCDECYLRYKTVKNLIKANTSFIKMGYKIKLYDCYRPLDVQKKMWNIVPDANYVASPQKGSIHNRGGAVDITLVDKNGNELNMGTPFDYFGEEAGHSYKSLSEEVLKNRNLLKKVMTENNFDFFETEWWHYNLIESSKFPVSNFKWKCN
ncbi:MAG: M15 family metallopeptidase [Flavobacterium sp.]